MQPYKLITHTQNQLTNSLLNNNITTPSQLNNSDPLTIFNNFKKPPRRVPQLERKSMLIPSSQLPSMEYCLPFTTGKKISTLPLIRELLANN